MARIYQRNDRDGFWYLDYRTTAGRRKRMKLGKSKKLAELALADFELKRQRGELGFDIPEISLKDFFDKNDAHSKSINSTSQTQRIGIVRTHFENFLKAHYPALSLLSQLTPQVFEHFQQHRLSSKAKKSGKPIKRKTINIECQVLKTAMKRATEWGYLRDNPCCAKKLKEVDSKKVRALTGQEAQTLLDKSVKHWLHPVIRTMLYAGLRTGECRYLTWKDVDFAGKIIKIQRKEGWVPKSSGGVVRERDVYISDELVSFLQRHKLASPKDNNWVFHGLDGAQLLTTFCEPFAHLTKRLGFGDVTQIHALRHTYITHLLKSGVDIATVQEQAGHVDIKTTRRYIDVFTESKQKAAQALKYSVEDNVDSNQNNAESANSANQKEA